MDTGCEYSYVVHHRESDDPQSPGLHNPHTHVVLPGTVWSEESGERIPLYFSRNKKVNHIEMLHDVTEQNMVDMLDRYVGVDWDKRMDALDAKRAEQKRIIAGEPHGHYLTEDGECLPFWGGIRQVDEAQCAVGYYTPFTDEDGDETIQFRPVASGLDTDYAERLSAYVASGLHEYPDVNQLTLYRETINVLLEEDREDIPTPQRLRPAPSPDFDL
ncbi:hypothetical protein HC928_23505 [bacterium]|nr:hypothetical protein [bacterium]